MAKLHESIIRQAPDNAEIRQKWNQIFQNIREVEAKLSEEFPFNPMLGLGQDDSLEDLEQAALREMNAPISPELRCPVLLQNWE